MVPNILIAPLSDKVKGAALYHKPTARIESYGHFQFGKTMEDAGSHHHPPPLPPPFRVPQADTIAVPGGKEAGQEVERPLA